MRILKLKQAAVEFVKIIVLLTALQMLSACSELTHLNVTGSSLEAMALTPAVAAMGLGQDDLDDLRDLDETMHGEGLSGGRSSEPGNRAIEAPRPRRR